MSRTPPPPAPDGPRLDDYRPLSRRARLAIVALAVGTAVGVVLLLLDPPGGVQRRLVPAPAVPDCSASAAAAGVAGCVGGKASVILSPASAASR